MKRALYNVVCALLLLVFAAVVILSFLYGPDFFWRANYGFGPEMDCQRTGGMGSLNCIRKPTVDKAREGG
jgi:hypothetical protein